MTGSVLDGEDIVQEALFQAYRKLDSFDDCASARRRGSSESRTTAASTFCAAAAFSARAETAGDGPDHVLPADPAGPELGRAVGTSGADAAAQGTGVRAAEGRVRLLARGNRRARRLYGRRREGGAQPRPIRSWRLPRPEPPARVECRAVAAAPLHVERFNRRDWDGLRKLISADARLEVADRFSGRLTDSP